MKIDVLAVIDDILSTPTGMLADEVKQLKRASDRIAELIAADEEYDAAVRDRDHCFASGYHAAEVRVAKARARRAAALLACKGQDHER